MMGLKVLTREQTISEAGLDRYKRKGLNVIPYLSFNEDIQQFIRTRVYMANTNSHTIRNTGIEVASIHLNYIT